ncbi:MAG: type III pantothenate kinase [Myxococcaceae bacterium]
MLAVIDIGNTNVVLGVYEGSTLKCRLRFRTERKATSDELGHLMSSLLVRHAIMIEQIEAVCVSSVVTQLDAAVLEACCLYFGKAPLWAKKELDAKMPLLIDRPEELGADRLVNAYAAWKKYQSALIVIDMGTATTFDVVSSDGAYLGGAIAPGVEIASEALFQTASKLSRVSLEKPVRAIGKNTKEHIQIGLVLGHAGLIDGLVARMQEELASPCTVIATGGLAPFMKQASKTIQTVEPDLTLFGLCLLYQEYKSGTRDSFVLGRPQCVVGHQEAAC